MKRTTKLTAIVALSVTATALTAFTATGCKGIGSQSQGAPYYDTLTVYAQAQELGYNGTLDEFIAMISGKDGENGKDGTNGKDGEKGDKGDDGVGVKSGYIDEDGHLILTLTDDSEIDCGAIGKSHQHTFGDWIIIKKADCTTAGLKIRGCEDCDQAEHIVLPSLGHDWSDWTFKNNVSHSRTCGTCHETESVPHTYEDGVCTDCGYASPATFGLPLAEIDITTPYDFIMNENLMGSYAYHTGLDFAAPEDTEVFAVLDGTVKSIVLDNKTAGKYIILEHENGYQTKYRFANPVEGLAVGDEVTKGEVIGIVDTTLGFDFKREKYFHFELIVHGKADDPKDYIDFTAERIGHVHTFGEWSLNTEATCTVDGSKSKTCDCGYSYSMVIPAAHGEPVYEEESDTSHNVICSVCEEILDTEEHKFNEHTCSLCGYTETVPPEEDENS